MNAERFLQLSQVEHRLLHALADGKGHKPEELLGLIDDLANRNNLRVAISGLRKKIAPFGQDIVAQSFGKCIKYRRIRVFEPELAGT